MNRVMENIQAPRLTWGPVKEYLAIHYPASEASMSHPPYWVQQLMEKHQEDEDDNGEWKTQKGTKGKSAGKDHFTSTIYGFWKEAIDIAYIGAPANAKNPPEFIQQMKKFFAGLGFSQLPPVPTTNRSLRFLQEEETLSVWSMSPRERQTLARAWEDEIRQAAYTSNLDNYGRLREEYEMACKEYNDAKDEV